MTPLNILVDVPERAGNQPQLRRVAGLLDDNQTLVVATMVAGDRSGALELGFKLSDAVDLAHAALSGDRRALTHPGIARKLSATVAVLFRVCVTTGAVIRQQEETDAGTGHFDDREAAADDADLEDASL